MSDLGNPSRTRRKLAISSAVALLMMTGGLWWAGAHIQSSSQAAARAQPPPSAIITAPVRTMIVQSTLTLAGSVAGGKPEPVDPPTLPSGEAAVITRVSVSRGTWVRAGQLLADVSGRPVFVLSGKFPMYRSLSPGMHGPDVAELQTGLQEAGYPVNDLAGHFGPSTLAALRMLYSNGGYPMIRAPAGSSGTAEVARSEPLRQSPRPAPMASPPTTSPSPRPSSARGSPSPEPTPSSAPDPSPSAGGTGQPRTRTIPVVPVGEIAFVARLPATVTAVNIAVGPDSSNSPIMTLSSGAMSVEASLGSSSASSLRIGMTAIVTAQGATHTFGARVAVLPTGGGTVVKLTPSRPLPASLTGQTASVVIILAKTRSRVLAVPVSALRSNASGSTALGVVIKDRMTLVAVHTGQVGDGYVEIVNPPAAIDAGVKVAVGHG